MESCTKRLKYYRYRGFPGGKDQMKATGTRQERETIINWNEEDDLASVWTSSGVAYRGMIKRGWVPAAETKHSSVFYVPVEQIKLPRSKSKRGFASRKDK